MTDIQYQVIHQGKPGYTGTQEQIVSWATFNNMQYGGPERELGFANFKLKRVDDRPLTPEEDAFFAEKCKYVKHTVYGG